MKVSILFIWFLCLLPNTVLGQYDNKRDSSFLQLPPLDLVLDAALKHSPLLKINAEHKKTILNEIQISKKKWLDYFYLEGRTNYGLFNQILISEYNIANTPAAQGIVNKSENISYYAGFAVKLPLSSLASRKNQTSINKVNLSINGHEHIAIQKEIKQEIITSYFELKYMEESMRTFYDIYQTLKISHLKAEQDLLNGRIAIDAYALLTSTTGKAKDDFNKARHNYYAHYHLLQDMTGIIFEHTLF